MKQNLQLSLLFTLMVCTGAIAQAVPENIRAANTLDVINDGIPVTQTMIYGIPAKPGKVVGDTYLFSEEQTILLQLKSNGAVIGVNGCRLNLYTNQFEVNDSKSLKVVDGAKIRSFAIVNKQTQEKSYYLNGDEFKLNAAPVNGFLQVLVDGKLPLLKQTSILVKEPDYKMEIHVGNKDFRLLKREALYMARNKELLRIKKIRKRDCSLLFGSLAGEMQHFLKVNSLGTGEDAVVRIIKQFNSILKSKYTHQVSYNLTGILVLPYFDSLSFFNSPS